MWSGVWWWGSGRGEVWRSRAELEITMRLQRVVGLFWLGRATVGRLPAVVGT